MKCLVNGWDANNGESGGDSLDSWEEFQSPAGTELGKGNSGNSHSAPEIRWSGADGEFEWQRFSAGDEPVTPKTRGSNEYTVMSTEVMKSCFKTTRGEDQSGADAEVHVCCNRPCQSSRKSFLCPLIQLALHKAVLPQCDGECTQQQLHLDFPAQCSDFDWDADDHCKRDDISPMLFRPGHPESPVGLDFDHKKASLGLSMLSDTELKAMCQEMERKFSRLSESLVIDLQLRDRLVTELTVKNKFVSAMLRVQSLKQSSSNSAGGGDLGGRMRSRSLRSKVPDERANGKYLSSIIPYCPPKDNNWSVSTLMAIIEILDAIAKDSADVSTLVAEFLQNEVL